MLYIDLTLLVTERSIEISYLKVVWSWSYLARGQSVERDQSG